MAVGKGSSHGTGVMIALRNVSPGLCGCIFAILLVTFCTMPLIRPYYLPFSPAGSSVSASQVFPMERNGVEGVLLRLMEGDYCF